MAQFGSDAAAPFNKLKSIIAEIFAEANQWARLSSLKENSFPDAVTLRKNQEEIQKSEKILWSKGTDDPIQMRVNKAIEDIEAICQPHINCKR